MVPINAAQAGEVHRFIQRFTEHGPQVKQCFCQGCCYDALSNHFAAQIGKRVYDITGDVTDRALSPWQPWAGYEEGSSHRAGIIRNCILFAEEEE